MDRETLRTAVIEALNDTEVLLEADDFNYPESRRDRREAEAFIDALLTRLTA